MNENSNPSQPIRRYFSLVLEESFYEQYRLLFWVIHEISGKPKRLRIWEKRSFTKSRRGFPERTQN